MARRPIRRQCWYAEGFTLTVDEDGLHVEVTDYHARPLHLAWSELKDLGLAADADNPTLNGEHDPEKAPEEAV